MIFIFLFCSCVVSFGNEAEATSKIVFPDDGALRKRKEIDTGITPPKLPYIAHLENDPSTLLPNETNIVRTPTANAGNVSPKRSDNRNKVESRFGFSHGFDVSPNVDGGLTASFSHGVAGSAGNSQAASQSVSFGFNNGFQASHSSSQSHSFNNGFGNSFGGSQANSQASSISAGLNGLSSSSSAASSAALAGGGISAAAASSQSASGSSNILGGSSLAAGSSFGSSFNGASSSGSHSSSATFNELTPLNNILKSIIGGNIYTDVPNDSVNFGEGNIDIRYGEGVSNNRKGTQNSIIETSIIYPFKPFRRQQPNHESVMVQSNIDRWRPTQINRRNNDEVFIVEF